MNKHEMVYFFRIHASHHVVYPGECSGNYKPSYILTLKVALNTINQTIYTYNFKNYKNKIYRKIT